MLGHRHGRRAGRGAEWRAAGALGRTWRLHKAHLPAEALKALEQSLLAVRASLLPWLARDSSCGEQLLAVLAALAGAPTGRGKEAMAPVEDATALKPELVAEHAEPAPSTPWARKPAEDAGTPPRIQRPFVQGQCTEEESEGVVGGVTTALFSALCREDRQNARAPEVARGGAIGAADVSPGPGPPLERNFQF